MNAGPREEELSAHASLMQAMQLRVRAIAWEAQGILTFDLRPAHGDELAPFAAGAHIDVHVRPGLVRQYSLCNDPVERHRYVVAVQREEKGRGGSRAMHDEVRAGDLLTVGAPRNFFPLAQSARHHLLVAGGIGVTPMMAMVAQLEARGDSYRMHYCTRSPDRTAFLERLAPLVEAGKVAIHHDGGDPARGMDLAKALENPEPGTHLYYCGPAGFMDAVKAAAAHWPEGSVHCEHFAPPASEASPAGENHPFTIRLVRSRLDLDVPADRTIVEVLRENDVFVETSCEQGYCGTCLTRYVEGEPEHRDSVLDQADRREFVLVCCARSRTPVLALDL